MTEYSACSNCRVAEFFPEKSSSCWNERGTSVKRFERSNRLDSGYSYIRPHLLSNKWVEQKGSCAKEKQRDGHRKRYRVTNKPFMLE